jgi:hypothetical protein
MPCRLLLLTCYSHSQILYSLSVSWGDWTVCAIHYSEAGKPATFTFLQIMIPGKWFKPAFYWDHFSHLPVHTVSSLPVLVMFTWFFFCGISDLQKSNSQEACCCFHSTNLVEFILVMLVLVLLELTTITFTVFFWSFLCKLIEIVLAYLDPGWRVMVSV